MMEVAGTKGPRVPVQGYGMGVRRDTRHRTTVDVEVRAAEGMGFVVAAGMGTGIGGRTPAHFLSFKTENRREGHKSRDPTFGAGFAETLGLSDAISDTQRWDGRWDAPPRDPDGIQNRTIHEPPTTEVEDTAGPPTLVATQPSFSVGRAR